VNDESDKFRKETVVAYRRIYMEGQSKTYGKAQ